MTSRIRIILALAVLATGCVSIQRELPRSLSGIEPLGEPAGRIAVLPVVRAGESLQEIPADAGMAVTAQIYKVLAESPRWDFVPDLEVMDTLPSIPATKTLKGRARLLGQAVKANSVLFGKVTRYRERKGSAYGSSEPSAVSIELYLVAVESGDMLWSKAFRQEQEALSSNFLNFWQFWSAGPKWFTAREFAGLGVDRMLGDLDSRID